MDSYMLFTRAKIHLVKCIYGYLCKITIMYIYHKYIDNLDSVLNGRLPLSKLSDTIKTHQFQFKGKKKEYWIHNLQIIADETSLNFSFVNDIECFINDGWICQGIGNEMGTYVFCVLVVTCCGDRLEHCDRIHSCVLSEETT